MHQPSGQGSEQGQPCARLSAESPLIQLSGLIQEVCPAFNFYHLHDESLQLPCVVTKTTCANRFNGMLIAYESLIPARSGKTPIDIFE